MSGPRYNRYLIATGNDKNRARKLYNANIRLAQAFHPILTQFEVVLRNAINSVLSNHFGDADWILTQKIGFMRDRSLRRSNFYLKQSVQKSENKLIARGISVTSGKIISDQMFSFWIALFLSHHYILLGGQPIHVFSNKNPAENRASIHSKLMR